MSEFEKYIQSYTHNGHIGVLVEFGLESSMPPRSEEFIDFSRDVAMHIAAENPSDISEFLTQQFIKDPEKTTEQLIQQMILKCEENIKITRFIRWDTDPVKPESKGPPPKSPAVAMRVVK